MGSIEAQLNSARILSDFATVSERYYERRYYRDQSKPDSDHCVLIHTNNLCVITLSPNHDIIRNGKSIKSVDYCVDGHANRLENKVSGKWKKGGQKVTPNSVLCRVVCDDDQQCYDIMACIHGTIVEVNHKLISDCSLLAKRTWSDGYVAIILPYRGHHESQKESLLTCDEYEKLLSGDNVS